jgi:hypothetical protein
VAFCTGIEVAVSGVPVGSGEVVAVASAPEVHARATIAIADIAVPAKILFIFMMLRIVGFPVRKASVAAQIKSRSILKRLPFESPALVKRDPRNRQGARHFACAAVNLRRQLTTNCA